MCTKHSCYDVPAQQVEEEWLRFLDFEDPNFFEDNADEVLDAWSGYDQDAVLEGDFE